MGKQSRLGRDSKLLCLMLFFFIGGIVTTIWFGGGLMLAGAEEGLPFYNPLRTADTYRYSWQEAGTGYIMPLAIPRAPFFRAIASLSRLGLASFAVQAFMFFCLISVAGLSVFWLVDELIDQRRKVYVALSAAIFYTFNLFTLSQVWHRQIYSGMFAWSYLPLFLFLWVKWLREGASKWLFGFVASSLFFSNAFGTPAFLFTFSVPAAIFVLMETWSSKRKKQACIRLLSKSFLALILWSFVNIWWIYPYIRTSKSAFAEISSVELNFGSLRGASSYFPISEIVLLRQKYFFNPRSNPQLPWGRWHEGSFAVGLSWLAFGLSSLGWWKLRKKTGWGFLSSLALVGLFISKGVNRPFGDVFFKGLFYKLPFTAVLRNPYEKFGIVWLLPYSIFFGVGLNWLFEKLKPKVKELATGTVLFLVCGVLVWPMWRGGVFPGYAMVDVPEYYQKANDFINKDDADVRILMLPMVPSDGVRYTWDYRGIEPSQFLFDKPAVSKIFRTQYADKKYEALYDSFANNGDYNKFLKEMNIKYLVLHNDIDWEPIGASSSAQAKRTIGENQSINFIKEFGKLAVYEYEGNNFDLFIVEGEDIPKISYRKLNPTRYVVDIKEAKTSFTLIFKETFNNLWEAKIDGERVGEHSLVYDYANAWKIETEGNYEIDIAFKVWPWE